MRALRVLYLTHYAELYGANRSLLDLVVGARDSGAVEPFVVLACEGDMCAELERHGIRFAVVPFSTWMHKRIYMGGPHHRLLQRWRHHRAAVLRDRGNRKALTRLVALGREQHTQLVHANSSVIGLGGPLARELNVPFIWHIRELPFLHYGFHVDGGLRRYTRELRSAQRIIAISQAVADDVQRLIGRSDRSITLSDGVISASDLNTLRPGASSSWAGSGPFIFLSIGLHHPSKGQDMAIEAFSEVHRMHPTAKLLMAGSGRDERVKELIAGKGLQGSVELLGFVRDTNALFERGHVLLQCSRHEALGRVTLEAMAHGLPVIGHRSGATPELVRHGENGLLFSTRDELVRSMNELIISGHGLRRMGEAGRATIAERFTVDHMVQRTLEVYAGTTGSK